jgi:YegS/Rv2252/BmrU family lipid kinase
MEISNIQIVVNPTAGSGKAGKIAMVIFQKIKSLSDSVINLTFTEKKNDASFITREAIIKGAGMIVAVGGDGTINEVVNGFFKDNEPLNPFCELGIINCGTGGGYAKTLGIPQKLEQQIELILRPGSINLDLGYIIYQDFSNNTLSRLFVNECQTGIGSKVASVVGKNYKVFGGTLAFGLMATVQAILIKPVTLELEYDNEPVKKTSLIGLVVGNGIECAGGMKLTPDAKLNDGFFDVLSMHNMSIAQRLLNLSKVYSGKHILSPYFSVKRCKRIKIGSNQKVTLEADGEVLGYSPFEIINLPSAIRIKAVNNRS